MFGKGIIQRYTIVKGFGAWWLPPLPHINEARVTELTEDLFTTDSLPIHRWFAKLCEEDKDTEYVDCLFSVAELEELLDEIKLALCTEPEADAEADKITRLDLRSPHTCARTCTQLKQFADAAHAHLDEMRELEQSYIIKHGYRGDWSFISEDAETK
ncbi:MAG: hypothetical protein WC145_07820 [Aliarcobacter sp.]